jgi:hypothetical protein
MKITLPTPHNPGLNPGRKDSYMTVAELKAALDLAMAEAAAKPDDADLKSKVEAAKVALAAAEAAQVDPEVATADEKTKKYIESLRKENAKYRTQAKEAASKLSSVEKAIGAVGDETPEAKAARVAQENETIAFDNAVLSNAVEHGVSKESIKYFKYLIAEAAGSLGEGEELAEDKIAEIAKEVKAKSVKPAATTTVTSQATAPAGQATSGMTPEQFVNLGFNDKCKLYETQPDLYASLMKQATAKRLLK